jgi:hypothetical protein
MATVRSAFDTLLARRMHPMTRDREDTEESRGPVGGPREAGHPVAPDDEHGSRRGAAESQERHEAAEPQEIAIDEQASPPDSAHMEGVEKGEEIGLSGKEPGREATGTSGADRPSGKRTARDSTVMGGVEPTEPEMPDMPPA